MSSFKGDEYMWFYTQKQFTEIINNWLLNAMLKKELTISLSVIYSLRVDLTLIRSTGSNKIIYIICEPITNILIKIYIGLVAQ